MTDIQMFIGFLVLLVVLLGLAHAAFRYDDGQPLFFTVSWASANLRKRYRALPKNMRPITMRNFTRQLRALDKFYGIAHVNATHSSLSDVCRLGNLHTPYEYVDIDHAIGAVEDSAEQRRLEGKPNIKPLVFVINNAARNGEK